MQILSVALTNFKTHQDRQFDFHLGTNAICGENGAGKTSILEAIAWVLFNYQGSYKKEDLIRNGASSAKVNVTFISSRDSRTYDAQRSTSGGYILFDPQLNERLPLTRTKDEVLPWLRHHLGVSPGTDLGQLFSNTIGVPQGTFTADFLLSTEKRKPIFDTILKVEEYRETYKQSIGLKKYADAQVQRLKDLVEQYEETLQGWDELQNRQQQLKTEITLGETQLAGLEEKTQQLAKRKESLQIQAEKAQTLNNELKALVAQIAAQQQAQTRLESTFSSAQAAQKVCEAHQTAYNAFVAAEKQAQTLSESQQKRQAVLLKQQQLQQSLSDSKIRLSKLTAKAEQFAAANQQLVQLADDIKAQNQTEEELSRYQQQQQQFENARFRGTTLKEQIDHTSKEVEQIQAEIKQLKDLEQSVAQIPDWEAQKNRLQAQISRVAAAQQFEQEISALASSGQTMQDDYRQQVVAALKTMEGWVETFDGLRVEAIAPIRDTLFQGGLLSKQTLETLHSILADLAQQTNPVQLKREQTALQAKLAQAYKHQAEIKNISGQQRRLSQLRQAQQESKNKLADISKQLAGEAEVSKRVSKLEEQLQALDNPRGKQTLIKQMLAEQPEVENQQKSEVDAQQKGEQALAAIAKELSAFEKLDTELRSQQQQKQKHQAGYLLFLQNQQAAQQIPELEKERAAAIALRREQQSQQTTLEAALETLTESFDPESFRAIEQQHSQLTSQADRLRGSLPQLQQRFADLDKQIASLKTIAQKRDQAQAEIKQRDRTRRFVNYARKVYKEAGPRITERYVHSISREADRLFRELLGRANVALTWSADYEITVQEGAHTRRFINLSGGEQMCAALAVRLALLKVLADIDIAFFDEPTTNMDRPRRASLAEAITRISSFKQLFVISHDDTFEQVTETVITVERDT